MSKDITREILANLIGQLFIQSAELQAQIIALQTPPATEDDDERISG